MNTSPGRRILFLVMSPLAMTLAAASVASAHHSAAASYEANQSIEIKGKVLEFAWRNPHGHLYIDVTRGPFAGQTYAVELSSPGALVNDGWTKTLLQPGDDVVIHVHPSRAGGPAGLCRNCALTINGKVTKPRPSGAVSSGVNWRQYSRICPPDFIRIS